LDIFIAFLGLAAFIAVMVFLVLGIIHAVKKNGKAKRTFLYSAAAFVVMLILVSISPDTPAAEETASAETAPTLVEKAAEPAAAKVKDHTSEASAQSSITDSQADAEKQKALAEERAKKEAVTQAAAEAQIKADKKAAEAEQKMAAAKAKAAKEAAAQSVPGTIGMTADQFRTAFNNSSTEIGMDMRLPKLTVSSGTVQNTFQYMLSDNIALTGIINKADGSVREINLLGQTAGSYEESANYLLAMGLIMKAVDPGATKEENATKMRKLGLMDENLELANLNKQTIANGLKYSVSYLDGIGIMFYVNNADDK